MARPRYMSGSKQTFVIKIYYLTKFITFENTDVLFLMFQIYLSQFGYLPATARNPANGGLLDSGTWSKAIMEFQGFAGINATGKYKLARFLIMEILDFEAVVHF